METESGDSDNNGDGEEPKVKRTQKLARKSANFPRLTDTDPEGLNDDNEEKEALVKKVSKSLGDVETGPEDSGDSDSKHTLGPWIFLLINREEGLVFKKEIYRGEKILYVATFDTGYLKKMLTSSDIDKKTKETIKQFFNQRH